MAARRRDRPSDGASTPTQQDEADILAEVGAERDADSGDTFADEAKVREIGAMDAESVRENRRLQEIVDKKRGNVPHVPFNSDDVLVAYQHLLRVWAANTLHISIKRMSGGSPVQYTITSQPKTAAELYDAIRACHGPNEEATYKVAVIETATSQYKLNGRITVPDARPAQGQQQPMNGQQPNTHQPAAATAPSPQVDLLAMQRQMFDMLLQMQAVARGQQPATPSTPAPAPAAAAPSAGVDLLAMQKQMFDMLQQMQAAAGGAATQANPPPAAVAAPAAAPAPQVDPLAMQRQMFDMMLQMMQAASGSAAPARSASPPPAQQQQPPPVDPMAMMGQFFEMFMKMQQSAASAARQAQPPSAAPYSRGPYLGPRPGYDPQHAPTYAPQAHQPPKSPAEQFRESITSVRAVAEELQGLGLWPDRSAPAPKREEPEEEDAPVKVMDVGDYKLVIDKRDGSARKYETVVANLTPIMKWVGEQREAIQKAHAEREQKMQQQLPPGYVEVTPGFVPPPGYVVVPEQPPAQVAPQQQQALPPPPAQMPAPIGEEPQQQPQRRTWGAPTIPGGN